MLCLIMLLLISMSALSLFAILEVDIAAMGMLREPRTLPSLAFNVAPMEMAVEEMNLFYNRSMHFNLDLVYDANHTDCSQYLYDAPRVAAEWYYKKKRPETQAMSVVVSPGSRMFLTTKHLLWNFST